jgi:hypothetical protein
MVAILTVELSADVLQRSGAGFPPYERPEPEKALATGVVPGRNRTTDSAIFSRIK